MKKSGEQIGETGDRDCQWVEMEKKMQIMTHHNQNKKNLRFLDDPFFPVDFSATGGLTGVLSTACFSEPIDIIDI